MLDLFEKLINEHGSSAILKERITLIQAEYAALERKCADLEAENKTQRTKLEQMERQAQATQTVAGKPVFCKSCGSANLVRNGAKPDQTFGDLGVDRILFRCNDCGAESGFLDA